MKGKRILVTGGGGFIGSNLVKALERDNEVVVVDDFSTGRRENLRGVDDITLVEGSITDKKLMMRVMKDIDYVFHEGALPSVPRSVKDPLTSNDVNVQGTLNVAVTARDNNVEKLVFASSSSAYGDTPVLPKVETMPPRPQSPYAVTKVAGEYYLKVFYELYGLRTTSLRYFNVFGPGQDPNSQYSAVIPKFVRAIIHGKPPVIYGDGEQSRDFTFVKDVIQANVKAAESKRADGEIINVAKGDRTTVNELAEIILKAFGKENELQPIHDPPRPGDVRHSLADITKARELMGYEPEYTLADGLEETLNYFKEYFRTVE